MNSLRWSRKEKDGKGTKNRPWKARQKIERSADDGKLPEERERSTGTMIRKSVIPEEYWERVNTMKEILRRKGNYGKKV